ncbi:hypothetical protein AZI86_14325 [Bdellovibrio bacteriovorus]|uniref:Uncharacterized protein n=1 Tax=Bdellovibrio bacteriovorus TaxID=959 RepID=A0A150WJT6_BDEBC|nr:hypothetical protein [Bdellovibrio bacteriovorus]KYG63982.1 hypothetical protein AZI86_14325 [Bdellovibrio bacteriovorus]
MFKVLLILSVFSFVPGFALATKLADTYRFETQKILRDLDKLGIDKIACISKAEKKNCFHPLELLKIADQVKWVELESFHKAAGTPRGGAFYSPIENTIYLNKSVPHIRQFIGYVGLHEILGLVGATETDFGISLAAYRAIRLFDPSSKNLQPTWRWDIIKTDLMTTPEISTLSYSDPEYNKLRRSTEGGGVFVGGGGGDTRSFQLRVEVFEHMSKYVPIMIFVDMHFANVSIEVINSNKKEIYYHTVGSLLNRIFVPESLLNLRSLRDPRVSFAVEDIAWFLASTYPQFTNIPYKTTMDGRVEPVSLRGLHPKAIKQIWCEKNNFSSPIRACDLGY